MFAGRISELSFSEYYFANILSVNRFVDFFYEKPRKYHTDAHGGVI